MDALFAPSLSASRAFLAHKARTCASRKLLCFRRSRLLPRPAAAPTSPSSSVTRRRPAPHRRATSVRPATALFAPPSGCENVSPRIRSNPCDLWATGGTRARTLGALACLHLHSRMFARLNILTWAPVLSPPTGRPSRQYREGFHGRDHSIFHRPPGQPGAASLRNVCWAAKMWPCLCLGSDTRSSNPKYPCPWPRPRCSSTLRASSPTTRSAYAAAGPQARTAASAWRTPGCCPAARAST